MVSPARKRMTAAEFLEWAAGPESRRRIDLDPPGLSLEMADIFP